MAVADALGQVVGENLRRLREARGMTQAEAANFLRGRSLAWGRGSVAAIEAGNRETVDFGTVVALAHAFEVPLGELFAGEGDVLLAPGLVVSRQCIRGQLVGQVGWIPLSRPSPPEVTPLLADADAELADRLGLRPEDVYEAAERLWSGRNLRQERDRRLAAYGELSAAERRARRGHITRELARELAPHLLTNGGQR